jgi:hypothetical protein
MNIHRSDLDQFNKAFDTTRGLADVVRRLIQEVEVLKSMLESRNVWDKEQYKRLLKQRMIDDHSSLGCGSWLHYSSYPYVLDEGALLKYRFDVSDQELAEFKNEVDYISTLT